MSWIAVAQLLRMYERPGDRSTVLAVSVQLEPLLVVAIETSYPPKDARAPAASAAHVFGAHGHKVVGEFDSLPQALEGGERFGLQWQLGRSIERCDCEEIDELSHARRARRRAERAEVAAMLDARQAEDES